LQPLAAQAVMMFTTMDIALNFQSGGIDDGKRDQSPPAEL